MKLGMVMNSGYNLVVGLVLTSVALTSICCVAVGAGILVIRWLRSR